MFLTRSEYDRGVNTFSPEGRLFQVEYAIETVKVQSICFFLISDFFKLGATSIGIHTKEGILLAAERRSMSKLVVADSMSKIAKIDKHIGGK